MGMGAWQVGNGTIAQSVVKRGAMQSADCCHPPELIETPLNFIAEILKRQRTLYPISIQVDSIPCITEAPQSLEYEIHMKAASSTREELHVEDNTETKLNNVHTLANTVSGLASSVDQMTEIMKKMVDRLDMLEKSYQDVKKRQSQLESSMASDFTEREDKPVELSNSNLTPIIDLTDDGEMRIIYDYVNKKNSPATPNNYHISPKDSTSHKKEIYVKKISFNGSPDRMELKIPKTEPQTKHTPTKRTVDEMMMSAGNKSVVRVDQTSKTAGTLDGITIPSFIRSNFKPTEEMHLTPVQTQVSVYVFHENNLPSEIIFKIDETQGSRQDFDTLRPDRGISPQCQLRIRLSTTLIPSCPIDVSIQGVKHDESGISH
ncbi:hypothetical protein SESBI_21167 [Sesbania bispinosa]|nr:hypothetical protein SESBI_21167 [Sesbania bispinosa]